MMNISTCCPTFNAKSRISYSGHPDADHIFSYIRRLRLDWLLLHFPPRLGVHPRMFWPRILASALSLSATGAFMVLFDVSHPPAGATTLIVFLGIISKPRELIIIEVAVFLLVAEALVINRLAGLPHPLWSTAETTKD